MSFIDYTEKAYLINIIDPVQSSEFIVAIVDGSPELSQALLEITSSYKENFFHFGSAQLEFYDSYFEVLFVDPYLDVGFSLLFDDYYTEFSTHLGSAELGYRDRVYEAR